MQPFWYQAESVQATWDMMIQQPQTNPVIVLPTGSGKSFVIAMLCHDAVTKFGQQVVVLAHRKELLEQNFGKIKSYLPDVPLGLYSAGLRQRECEAPVIVGGIQSVYNKAHLFGPRGLVIIDESHLVPTQGEGMYRTFLSGLKKYNPICRLIGLTATPYRTGDGAICRPDGLFHRVSYSAPVQRLIAERFLCKLINPAVGIKYDTSTLPVRGGEFVDWEMQTLFGGDDAKVRAACRELVELTRDRHSILIFASGVSHAEKIERCLVELTGEPVGLVTGTSTPLSRCAQLGGFKAGELRWLINVDVLTTGFDAPCVDAIAILRATQSPGLFAQICGRGLRKDPSKRDCLIIDYGENLARHGPVDAINYGEKTSGSGGVIGEAPTKKCLSCQADCHLSATVCQACGFKFPPRELKHGEQADQQNDALTRPITWEVLGMEMVRHKKKKGVTVVCSRCGGSGCGETTSEECKKCRGVGEVALPDSIKVTYECRPEGACGGNLPPEMISEWICPEHDGFARRKAEAWWRQHSRAPLGDIVEVLDLYKRGAIRAPSKITTVREGGFYRVESREFLEEIPECWGGEGDDSGAEAGEDSVDEWALQAWPESDIPF